MTCLLYNTLYIVKQDVLTNIQHKSGILVKYLHDIYRYFTVTLFYILRSAHGHNISTYMIVFYVNMLF
jgi:hypothetical protein